jgi:hypothetical protein
MVMACLPSSAALRLHSPLKNGGTIPSVKTKEKTTEKTKRFESFCYEAITYNKSIHNATTEKLLDNVDWK